MIEFPADVVPNSATPSLIDFGGVIRPATGGETLQLLRLGNRYRVEMTLPTETAEARLVAISRLRKAKREGLRVPYPLQGVDQAGGGLLVVDGAGQTGNSINLRGGTPGFVIREGFWLSIQRTDGRHYLHGADAERTISSEGKVSLPIGPNLRWPFADGATVHLSEPMIEGILDSDVSWNIALGNLIDGIGFAIEEVA